MVQKVQVVLHDDLDGSPADETVQFALDSVSYEIDLSRRNAKALRAALKSYVDAARVVRKQRGSSSRRASSRSAGRGANRTEATAAREWARAQGITVGERGRLPAGLLEDYRRAKK